MTFSDTAMMELGKTQSTDIHNTRSLIRALRYVLDILQTEEAFTVEEYKHTHTHTLASISVITPIQIGQNSDEGVSNFQISAQFLIKKNCHDSRTSDDIHMKLWPVTKFYTRNIQRQKKLTMITCGKIVTSLLFFKSLSIWSNPEAIFRMDSL